MNTYLSFNFKFETVLVSNERRKTNSRHEESQASHTCGRFRDTVADEVMPWVATGRDVLARGGVTTAFNTNPRQRSPSTRNTSSEGCTRVLNPMSLQL
jgi:hypothetical protein